MSVGCRAVKRTLAILMVAATALLSACGEDKAETYKKDFKPVNQEILDLGESVGKAVQGASGKSDAALAKEFGDLAERTGKLQQEVDELEPPDDLTAPQEDLTQAMGDAQDALEGIEKAAGENDANSARESAEQLVKASEDLRDSRRKIAKETGAKQ